MFHPLVPCQAGLVKFLQRGLAKSIDLVGYSLGGRLGMAFAKYFPDLVDRFTILSAHPGFPQHERVQREERFAKDVNIAKRILSVGERYVSCSARRGLLLTEEVDTTSNSVVGL